MQTRKIVHTSWAQLGIVLALTAGGIAGCAPSEPAGPEAPAAPADLAARAFQLTIDVATGKVAVRGPGRRRASPTARRSRSWAAMRSRCMPVTAPSRAYPTTAS